MKRKTEFLVGAVVVAAGIAAAAGVYRTGDSKAAEVPMVGIMPDVTAAVQITEQQEQDAGQQVQDVGQEVQDAGQQVQDVGQEVQDAGQQVGQQVSETKQGSRTQAVRRRLRRIPYIGKLLSSTGRQRQTICTQTFLTRATGVQRANLSILNC